MVPPLHRVWWARGPAGLQLHARDGGGGATSPLPTCVCKGGRVVGVAILPPTRVGGRDSGGGGSSPPTRVCERGRVVGVATLPLTRFRMIVGGWCHGSGWLVVLLARERGCWWLAIVSSKLNRNVPCQQGVDAPPLAVQPHVHLLLTYRL